MPPTPAMTPDLLAIASNNPQALAGNLSDSEEEIDLPESVITMGIDEESDDLERVEAMASPKAAVELTPICVPSETNEAQATNIQVMSDASETGPISEPVSGSTQEVVDPVTGVVVRDNASLHQI